MCIRDRYDAVLMKLINLDDFHPEPASKFADSVQGLSVLNRENPYADLIARMEEARDKYHLNLKCQNVDSTRINIIQEMCIRDSIYAMSVFC